MSDKPLDQQLISQAVEAGLSSQLDSAETVSVDVQTDLLKAVQGQVDSVTVKGQGIVKQDVRVQDMEINASGMAIDPLSALLGTVKLNQPIDANVRLTLNEADINQALTSEAIVALIPPLKLNVDGALMIVTLQPPLVVTLPADNRIALDGTALLQEPTGVRQVKFFTVIVPRSDANPLLLEAFDCRPGQGVSLEFTIALLKKFKEILDASFLTYNGTAFQVKTLEVHKGSLTLETEAQVQTMPTL